MLGKDKYSPEDCIRIIKNQPNPFPWIAVLAPKNKVMVLHSIWHFTTPFEYYHPNDGNILAFVHDMFKGNGLPVVHKIPINMFEGAKEWFHLNMETIMSKDPADCDVLPVLEDKDMVKTSMIIPIPIFLVPLFMNEGKPKHPVDIFQHFYHVFFKKAPLSLKDRTQHIHDFLLAATGYDESYDEAEPPCSQLAIRTSDLRVDSILFEWGTKQFGEIQELASKFEKEKETHGK